MRQWGKVDYKQLKAFQERLDKLESVDIDKFIESAAKELAARLLAKVIKRTPVGEYEDGRMGGTLRRGWTAKSESEAMYTAVFGGGTGGSGGTGTKTEVFGEGAAAEPTKKYVDALAVTKNGGTYEIELVNPVSYAIYVEYGHRTTNHKGWVEGRFMLTISEQELEAQMPAILERKLKKYLEEALLK